MGDFSQQVFAMTGPERVRPAPLPVALAPSTALPSDSLQPLGSPNPSIRSSHSDASSIPPWVRETPPGSIYSRPSRSSSIVSTRTRTSVNTFQEDTRSVDIQLGGRTFRINRDGSRVSERMDDLPPYSPPENHIAHAATPLHGMVNSTMSLVSGPFTRHYVDTGVDAMDTDDETPSEYLRGSTSTLGPPPGSGQQSSGNSGLSTPTSSPERIRYTERSFYLGHAQQSDEDRDAASVSRNPSYTPGKDSISVEKRRTLSLSQNHVPPKSTRGFSDTAAAQLKRRNGLRLPKIVTGLPVFRSSGSSHTPGSDSGGALSPSPSSHMSRSAGPTFAGDDNIKPPSSPTFIGRGATGTFPSKANKTTSPAGSMSVPSLLVPQSPAQVEENLLETSNPPAMDSPNDISIHYTRLIRSLDLSHRRALHERDTELSNMRERLNNIDLAYRKELKLRDTVIDKLAERVNALESAAEQESERVEVAIEKARNEVEDIWERRWKEKGKHLIEEFERREEVLMDRLRTAEGHPKAEAAGESARPSKFKTVALMVRAAVRFQHLADAELEKV
jgi:hypothetical protein